MRAIFLRLAALALIAALYLAFPIDRPDFSRFDAEDGEMYLALSYGLTHGLGYTRSLIAGAYIPHTTWPPGMALVLAPGTAFAALPIDWAAVKLPILAIALGGVALVWLYVRRRSADDTAADLAALLIALNPFYWTFSRLTLSEVPTFVWIIASLLLVDGVWKGRQVTAGSAAAVGLVVGLGMLIKSTLVGLILVPLAYAPAADRRRGFRAWLPYALGFGIAPVLWQIRNRWVGRSGLGTDGIDQLRMLFAAQPTDPESPLLSIPAYVAAIVDNLAHRIVYRVPEQTLPGLTLADWQHWPAAWALASLATLAIAAAAWARRTGAPLLLVVVPYGVLVVGFAGFGGGARFWVPVSLMTLVLVALSAAPAIRRLRPTARASVLAAIALAYGAGLTVSIVRHEREPLLPDRAQLAALFRAAAQLPDPPAALLTHHAGAYTFLTGRPAPLTAEGAGVEPRYTHLTTRPDRAAYPATERPPPGSVPLLEAGPWQLVALPAPMTLREIRQAGR